MAASMSTDLRRTTYSFRKMTRAEREAIKPLRIRLRTVKPGDTVESISARMPIETFAVEWFELLNGKSRSTPLNPGDVVRIVAE